MSCLVIAEKPSVAVSLAKVINASQRKDGYLEGNGWILPIIPEKWKYAVSPATGKQFAVLKQLMNRSDVEKPKINLRYR